VSRLATQVLEFALLAATSIFFLVDPFAVVPMFLAMTLDMPESMRRAMARRSASDLRDRAMRVCRGGKADL